MYATAVQILFVLLSRSSFSSNSSYNVEEVKILLCTILLVDVGIHKLIYFLENINYKMTDTEKRNVSSALEPTPSPYDAYWIQSSLITLSHIKSPTVLLVGEPALRIICEPISKDDINNESFLMDKYRLHRALLDFRAKNVFGRSIAAPQIGVSRRFLAINMGKGPYTLINPTIIAKSTELITLWDDCMSFPFIMVRKQRHASVSVKFEDDQGRVHIWENLDTATSELLQHEIDHLDGVLALDEPFGADGIVSRDVYERNREHFDEQVDYVIESTI